MASQAQKDQATALALQALGWIVSTDDLSGVFLNASGASAEDLRENAEDPAFLGSVLDFLMMDDAWVIGFCDEVGCAYTQPGIMRQFLPGGDLPNWT